MEEQITFIGIRHVKYGAKPHHTKVMGQVKGRAVCTFQVLRVSVCVYTFNMCQPIVCAVSFFARICVCCGDSEIFLCVYLRVYVCIGPD